LVILKSLYYDARSEKHQITLMQCMGGNASLELLKR